MSGQLRPVLVRIATALLLAALLVSVGVMHAAAAPLEPTMGLNELRARLLSSGGAGITGHFRTVLQGDAIRWIPVRVRAVTGAPNDVLDARTALILFEASGPEIDRIGGIAAGMSGSPVYVNVGGTDYLVGAVAYGDWFTLHGTGLATPIEAMSRVDSEYRASSPILDAPVRTKDGVKHRVIITSDPTGFEDERDAGAIIARPLATLSLGGIDARSPLFKSLAEQVEAKGHRLVPQTADLGTGQERFTTPFRAGSSLAVLLTRGDLWFGALGTVTYVNGDRLMALGHPLLGTGAADYYLSNAWVDGVWPSTIFPYKFGVPGLLRGTIVSDRNAGVLGRIGPMPAEGTVRAHAHRTDTGATERSAVAIPKSFMSSALIFGGLPAYAASIAGSRLYETFPAPGSAITTTTVVVSDETTTHTIVRRNVWYDDLYIPAAVLGDVNRIVAPLQAVHDAGIHPVEIKSVHLETRFSPSRTGARIVGVEVVGGLQRGDNRVRVSVLQRGVAATSSIDVTLTIPADASLSGQITASSQQTQPGGGPPMDPGSAEERRTPAEVIAALERQLSNDVLTVEYTPFESGGPGIPAPRDKPTEPVSAPAPARSITATVTTPWTLTGSVTKSTSNLTVTVSPRTVRYGSGASVNGTLENVSSGLVEIWGLRSGEVTESLMTTVPLEPNASGGGAFVAFLPDLTRNVRLRVVGPDGSQAIASQQVVFVRVAARVTLGASARTVRRGSTVTLKATVQPDTVTGDVVFERREGKVWKRIASRRIVAGAASTRFTPPSEGARVRARVSGRPTNAPGVSATMTIRVR